MLWNAGQDSPNPTPFSTSPRAASGRVVGEREHQVAHDQQHQDAEDDPAGAEPVDRAAARSDDQQAHQGWQREQQAHVREREPADLVEIDDVERQHQPGADELDHHDREQQPALARQLPPERAQAPVGHRAGRVAHRHGVSQPPPTPRMCLDRLQSRSPSGFVGYPIGVFVVAALLSIPALFFGDGEATPLRGHHDHVVRRRLRRRRERRPGSPRR